MLIRSKDGTMLINMENCTGMEVVEFEDYAKLVVSGGYDYLELGKYPNKNQAVKELEKIQAAYQYYKIMEIWAKQGVKLSNEQYKDTMVYQMK